MSNTYYYLTTGGSVGDTTNPAAIPSGASVFRVVPNGGASLPAQLPPVDANDLVQLSLTETSGSFANAGTAGGVWTPGTGLVRGEAVHFAGGVRVGSGIYGLYGSNDVEPTSITLWAWVRLRSTPPSDAIILGKPHSNAASPTWSDPYWSLRLGVGSSRQILAARVETANPIWASRSETSGGSLDLHRNYLVGVTYDGSRLSIWIDAEEIAFVTNSGTIAYGTAGVTPWVSGYVWSGGADRFDGYISAQGICDGVRPVSWWREAYRRGFSYYR